MAKFLFGPHRVHTVSTLRFDVLPVMTSSCDSVSTVSTFFAILFYIFSFFLFSSLFLFLFLLLNNNRKKKERTRGHGFTQ